MYLILRKITQDFLPLHCEILDFFFFIERLNIEGKNSLMRINFFGNSNSRKWAYISMKERNLEKCLRYIFDIKGLLLYLIWYDMILLLYFCNNFEKNDHLYHLYIFIIISLSKLFFFLPTIWQFLNFFWNEEFKVKFIKKKKTNINESSLSLKKKDDIKFHF